MKQTLIFVFISVLLFMCQNKTSNTSTINLRCEHLIDPIGIDAKSPRFSWQMESQQKGATQSAYQIVIATDSHFTLESHIWDSEKIDSDGNIVNYTGPALSPFTTYYWGVQTWDNFGGNSVSKIASFETGMMEMSNWKGSWITDSRDVDLKPAPYFRKEFNSKKEIKSARAYIAVAGLFELSVNGKKVGNHRLDPMYTRFDRRTLYVTHDVTDLLNEGENAFGVLLGNGWYNHQSTAVWYFHEAPWRGRPKFCIDLRIEYMDGTVETIASDDSWTTSLSPVIFNSIYTAEHYDARLEQPGWDMVQFDDSNWRDASHAAAPSGNIVAQTLHPIRNVEKIIPVSMKKFDEFTYVFDLGRNIAGVSQLNVKGANGTKIELVHGELVHTNGRVDLSNIDVHFRPTDDSDPFQTDIFILKGEGEESFMPRFNYKGFQYVEVISDKAIELTQNSLTAYFMHSDLPKVGKIESSNPTLNKIWEAGDNSYLSNLFGYPTDCPQREKNGWTGDAHIAIEMALYSYDGITVYEKWMADHRDEQQPNGVLPAIIPTDGWGYHWANGPDWTSTIALIPWNIYQFYGDTKILKDNYNNIKRYVDHIDDISPAGLTDWGLGDWVPVKSRAPKELTSSAYYFADAVILSKSAGILGLEEDEKKYAVLAEKIKNSINIKYLDIETGIYGKGLQTELSVPLFWGIVPENLVQKVAANLAKKVEEENFHIDVGLLGSKAILNALSENGYAEVAYKVASQETFPSWGWWIVNGATTFYENWNIEAKSDLSLNHIMFGEINAWYYKALGGIKPDPSRPGFKNVLLKPYFVEGLQSFVAEHDGPFGKIISSWKKELNNVHYTVSIPANSSATVWLKGNTVLLNNSSIEESEYADLISNEGQNFHIQLESGEYEFVIER
jgi:alpha-L-rhamnosidase